MSACARPAAQRRLALVSRGPDLDDMARRARLLVEHDKGENLDVEALARRVAGAWWVSPTQEHPHVREDARRIAREALTERGQL